MKRLLRYVMGGVIASLALLAATALYGLTMPREHLFLRRMELQRPPGEVWRVVTDYARQAEWHPGLARTEQLPEGAVGPLARALTGARRGARALEERARGDEQIQMAIRGAGDAGPVYEHLPQREEEPAARPVWRLLGEQGDSVLMQEERVEPPSRLLRRFRDERGRFEGSWDMVFETAGGGSRILLTERRRIGNPLRRAVTRLLVGQDREALAYLRGLAAHFGETADIERVPREYAKPLE